MTASPVIELDRSEMWLVECVAEKRDAEGWQLGRSPTLGSRDLSQDVLGATGECGLARFTRRIWNALRDDLTNLADIGDSFEAKAVRRRTDSLLVPLRKLRADRTYFLLHVAGAQVEVLGAVEGNVITSDDIDRSLSFPAYRIRQQDPRFIRGEALERFCATAYVRPAAELRRAA